MTRERVVLVGIDGSAASLHALDWAAQEAKTRGLGLRLVCAGKGNVIAAGWLGKIKTNLQFFCVIAAMALGRHWLTEVLTALMAAMTVASGAQYFWAARHIFHEDAA